MLALGIRNCKERHNSDQEDTGAALYLTEDRKVALNKVESGVVERFKV